MPAIPPPKLVYNQDTEPVAQGTYAVRVPLQCTISRASPSVFCEDLFLMWNNGRWYYLSSDKLYRGYVVGWIGPLPRLHNEIDIPF